MFCSLKNRIELQGKFFGTLLLLLVLKKKTYILNAKLAFYVVAGRVTHNAHQASQVQTWVAFWGKCWTTVTVWWHCCCSFQTGQTNLKWASGAYCCDFALFLNLKTRGYPTANRYSRDPYQQKHTFWLPLCKYFGEGLWAKRCGVSR